MKLWMSGELQSDVADLHREARRIVETKLNESFTQRDYGGGLDKWIFIAMILGADAPPYEEIKKYDGKKKTCEFRLRIDYPSFKSADTNQRAGLLCQALLECLNYLDAMNLRGVETEQIRADCLEVARSSGWGLPGQRTDEQPRPVPT